MQRQIRPYPFLRSLICTICCVIIAISTTQAWAVQQKTDSVLSLIGFSEKQFEDQVKEYLGTPYRKGGTTKKGMDCSGFARTIYDRFLGIDLPHSSRDQFQYSELQKINTRELQTGDLVFFASRNKKKKRINHVGIYLSDGQFIHASSTEGIMVSSLDEKYWKKRFVGSKRPVNLSSTENYDDYRFENYLEMPVHQTGIVTFYNRHEFGSLSPPENTPDAILYDPLEIRNTKLPSRSFNEIGYSQTLFAGFDISLGVFTEKFDSNTAWPEIQLLGYTMEYDPDETFSTSVRQGLTLSSDYHPSTWLSFTPSVTYFDHSGNDENLTHTPKRTLGLNTQLSPSDKSWTLSMLVQYTDGENLANLAGFDNKINSLDMAVKLGFSLTENMQLSIMSKYDKRSAALTTTDDTWKDQPASSDVAMVFNFSY